MKKKILIIFAIVSVSCSKNENNEILNQKTSLKSVKQVYPDPGGSFTYEFDGTKSTESIRSIQNLSEFVFEKFEYQNDLMSKYTTYDGLGDVTFSYQFKYDSNDKIKSVIYKSNSFEYEQFLTYQSNSIITEIPDQTFSNIIHKITYSFNDADLIENIKQVKLPDNKIEMELNFLYDQNENCVKIDSKNIIGNAVYEYEYTNKINPLRPHYAKYYIPHIIIRGKLNIIGNSVPDIVSNFGKNLLLRNTNYRYEHKYNGNNYPVSSDAYEKSSGTKAFSLKFNY